MDKINEGEVPTMHSQSPKGSFDVNRKHISMEMRGDGSYWTGPWEGGPPFDVGLDRIPPGKKNYPYHAHASQWEYYIILSGSGKFRDENDEWHPIKAGDHFQFAAGQAHQIVNDGESDLVYYVIADNTPLEIVTYPDTGKTLLLPARKLGYMKEAGYYDKEE